MTVGVLVLLASYASRVRAGDVPRAWCFSGFAGELAGLRLRGRRAAPAVGVLMVPVRVPAGAIRPVSPIGAVGAASAAAYLRTCAGARPLDERDATRPRAEQRCDAAKLLMAGIQHHGWVVVSLLGDNPRKLGTHRQRAGAGDLESAPRWAECGITT